MLYVADKEPSTVAEAGEKNEAEADKSGKITIPDLSSVVIPDLGGVDGIVGKLTEQFEKAKKEYGSEYVSHHQKLDWISSASLSSHSFIFKFVYL